MGQQLERQRRRWIPQIPQGWKGWRRAIAFLLCLSVCWGTLSLGLFGKGAGRAAAFAAPAEPSPVSESSDPPAPATNFATEDISAEKVSQFVRAYLQVLALVEEREGAVQAAETQLESMRLQQELETEAFALIEESGLTLQEYLQLLGLANTDPEFGERVATQLQEAA